MELSGDDLAGVVDLFGALTRAELTQALAELAFKRGEDADPSAHEDDVEAAVRSYHLLAAPPAALAGADDVTADVLVPGPIAFPTMPDGAEDLPHILEVDQRAPDREAVATAAEQRFRDDAAAAVDDEDRDRIETLLDVSYELEAWGPVELATSRDRLDAALAEE